MREALLLLASAGCTVPAVVTQPDAAEIVRKSIDVLEEDWKQAPNYSFIDREVQSKREQAPTVKSYEVLTIDRSPYRRLIAIDDKPLSPVDQADQERRMQREVEKRQHEPERERDKRINKYLKERGREHEMIREMVHAFQFRLAGEENVDGHDCWVLDTSPNPRYEPKDRESRVLMAMTGRLWIDKNRGQWVKAQAEVTTPVEFFGFLAKVSPGTRFVLQQEPITKDVWLPSHFSMQVNAAAFGIVNEDSTDDETYRDYKPMPQTLAGLQANR